MNYFEIFSFTNLIFSIIMNNFFTKNILYIYTILLYMYILYLQDKYVKYIKLNYKIKL